MTAAREGTYSGYFEDPRKAADYDERYERDTFDRLVWEAQIPHVRRIAASLAGRGMALDFATGTGRVASVLQDILPVIGVDSSAAMLARARERAPRAAFVQGDVTRGGIFDPKARFCLITAFRFMLNSEPETRQRALLALAGLLQTDDPSACIVLDNHGHVPSIKVIAGMRSLVRRRRALAGNVLSPWQLARDCRRAGLSVRRVGGYGLFGDRVSSAIGMQRAGSLENRLTSSVPVLEQLATNQLYIAFRTDTASLRR